MHVFLDAEYFQVYRSSQITGAIQRMMRFQFSLT